MIKAVIFDMDGLLVDTEVISLKIYQTIVAETGQSLTKQDYAQGYSGQAMKNNLKTLIDNYHLDTTVEALSQRVIAMGEELSKGGVALKAGAKELLTYLKSQGLPLVLATSSTRQRALDLLTQHGLLDNFQGFVTSEDVTHSKPDPEVFLKACQLLQVAPKDAVILENSQAGIQAGHAAGCRVLCVPDMKQPDEAHLALSEAVYKDLAEAIAYFRTNI